MQLAGRTQRSVCGKRQLAATPRPRGRASMAAMASAKPTMLVNSCTGRMGTAVAESALRAGCTLLPYTLCSPEDHVRFNGTVSVGGNALQTVPPGPEREALVEQLKAKHPGMITIDYTVPEVIHAQVDFYVKHKMPFVMGTTGGDRDKIHKQVQDAGLYAVIAPNMCKQIVAFQATMELMAANYPGAFSGYSLKIVESHQSTKKDTSGTAKALVKAFNGLGLNFDVSQIELVREVDEQVNRMKVPKDFLQGHAYHTYQLLSGDGSVAFEFQHNVNGRNTYAEGTVDAALFLSEKVAQKAPQTFYNMIDVLKGGSMR